MNRYVFYTLWCNILTISLLFVSRFLLEDRFHGSIAAVLISTIIGTLFLIAFSKALAHFPNQGLPEILEQFLPKWMNIALLSLFSLMMLSEGCLILGSLSSIMNRFLLPHLQTTSILALFFLFVVWGASRSSKTILSSLEIILIISTPIIYYLSFKILFNPGLEWNAIKEMRNYAGTTPKWRTITEATSTFSGLVGLSIFNRIVPSRIKGWFIALITLVVLHTLALFFLMPIGFLGTVGVNQFINPGVSSIDSLRFEFGLFERALFVFLLAYLMLGLIYAAITLHVGIELLKGCFSKRILTNKGREQFFVWGFLILVAILTGLYFFFFTEKRIMRYTIGWLEIRFITDFLLVVLVTLLALRKRRRRL